MGVALNKKEAHVADKGVIHHTLLQIGLRVGFAIDLLGALLESEGL